MSELSESEPLHPKAYRAFESILTTNKHFAKRIRDVVSKKPDIDIPSIVEETGVSEKLFRQFVAANNIVDKQTLLTHLDQLIFAKKKPDARWWSSG